MRNLDRHRGFFSFGELSQPNFRPLKYEPKNISGTAVQIAHSGTKGIEKCVKIFAHWFELIGREWSGRNSQHIGHLTHSILISDSCVRCGVSDVFVQSGRFIRENWAFHSRRIFEAAGRTWSWQITIPQSRLSFFARSFFAIFSDRVIELYHIKFIQQHISWIALFLREFVSRKTLDEQK